MENFSLEKMGGFCTKAPQKVHETENNFKTPLSLQKRQNHGWGLKGGIFENILVVLTNTC